MYRNLVDSKSKVMSETGRRLCLELGIQGETLQVKKLDEFREEYGDDDICRLHHRHHQKRRQKNLLRIFNYL